MYSGKEVEGQLLCILWIVTVPRGLQSGVCFRCHFWLSGKCVWESIDAGSPATPHSCGPGSHDHRQHELIRKPQLAAISGRWDWGGERLRFPWLGLRPPKFWTANVGLLKRTEALATQNLSNTTRREFGLWKSRPLCCSISQRGELEMKGYV